jgi:hypothetical protein
MTPATTPVPAGSARPLLAVASLNNQLLSVAGTIGVGSNQPSNANWGFVLHDGDAGSTDIPGVNYSFYFADASGSPNSQIKALYALGGTTGFMPDTSDESVKQAVLKTDDQQNFKLESFTFRNAGLMSGVVWEVTGYDDGVAVTGASYSFSFSTDNSLHTITLPDAFSDIDEIRISAHDLTSQGERGLYHTIFDSFVVADPVDLTPPTASIFISDDDLRPGETTTVTVTFSEAVSGLTLASLAAPDGSLSDLATADGGTTWTATYTPDATYATGNVITLASHSVTDAAGNSNSSAATSNTYTVATLLPSATIQLHDSALKAGDTTLVTITFSEAVNGFDNDDLAVENGTLSTVTSNDGITWTATFTPDAGISDSSNAITLADHSYTNVAGNAGSNAASANYTIETVRPTATVVITNNALKPGDTSLVTITFSEAVSGFDNSDLTISHGTLSAVSSNDGGTTWTATLTAAGSNSSNNHITVDNTGVVNAAGNSGTGSTSSNPYAVTLPEVPVPPVSNLVLAGGSSNDTLVGGDGNDVLQGGRSDIGAWSFFLDAQGQLVAQHRTTPGASTETLASTDLNHAATALAFTDASAGMLQGLATLYATAFGRAADLGGLNFWLQSGSTLQQIAQGFVQSPEFVQGAGALDNAGLVHAWYNNALGSAGAAAAVAEQNAWIARLDASTDHAAAQAELLWSLSQQTGTVLHWTGSNGMQLTSVNSTTEQGLIAGSGDDVLNGGAGSDLLVGGDGIDTVVYGGKLADYHIVLGATGAVTIRDIVSGDIDTIVQIEKGKFSDGTVDLNFTNSSSASLQQIGLLYQSVLNRPADIGGIGYWDGLQRDALTLAQQFLGSAEFQQLHANLDNAGFVTLIETNSLNHAPDSAALQSWTAYLDTHTRAELVVALIGSADVVAAQFSGAGLVLV